MALPWRTLLRGVALLNVLVWAGLAWWLWRSRDRWPPDSWLDRRWQLLLPLIAVAELFSWYSVLTTSNIGHVVEESLWGLCAALFVFSFGLMGPRVQRRLRPLLLLWGVAGLAYVVYMFGVDVPMYASRWLADEAAVRGYLTLAQGVADTSQRWVVSHHWDHWRTEVLWMTAYFSAAVWLSLALVMAPRWAPARDGGAGGVALRA